MTQQICKGRWIDHSGRTHNFEIESDRAERSHIIDLVEAMYPAKQVFVNSVRPKKTQSQVDHAERVAAANEERNNRANSHPNAVSGASSGNISSNSLDTGSYAEFNDGPASIITFGQMGVAAGLVASAFGLFVVWALLPVFGVLGGAFAGYKYTSKFTRNKNFHLRFWLVLVITISSMVGGGYLATGIHNITGYNTTQEVSQ